MWRRLRLTEELSDVGEAAILSQTAPQVLAISVWARGLGFAHNRHLPEAERETRTLLQIEERLRASGNTYWAHQGDFMSFEDMAWSAQAANKPKEAAELMRKAAKDEDGIEKLPLTPGPIIPAREQLGYLLLEQGDGNKAREAFELALVPAHGRRGALQGLSALTERISPNHSPTG